MVNVFLKSLVIIIMATLEEHLNTLSLKQIKNLVREHNLLSKIKLGQPKEALIAQLLEHFEELVDDDMVSSIYKIKVPKETDVVPKKGRKRIELERPAITQQEINPGEAVLRQMIEPKRKTGTLVSNDDKAEENIIGEGHLGRDGHGQLKILHGEEIHGKGEHWERFKKIGIPILATAAAIGAAYAGHKAYQNNNRVVTYKGYNPDSNWTPGSYRELQAQNRPQVPQLSQAIERIPRQLPIPPNAPPGSTSASVTRDWARGVRSYPPVAPQLPPKLGVIPYHRAPGRQRRIDLKAIYKAMQTGDESKLTRNQLERYISLK